MTYIFRNSTHEIADYFYITGIIRIYNAIPELIPRYKSLLDTTPANIPGGEWHINQYSTMLHEISHFIDLSTTTWGLEFQLRKARVLERGISDLESFKRASVFMLNLSELDMHAKLSRIYKPAKNLFTCQFRHAYAKHNEYGYIAILEFWDKEDLVCDTPVSMLSVFECNARAAEILAQLEHSKNDTIETDRALAKFMDHLSKVDLLEYNSLLILCMRAFEFTAAREKLTFFRCLVRYALNLNSIACSELSDALHYSIKNKLMIPTTKSGHPKNG